jgi:hypothetical protein
MFLFLEKDKPYKAPIKDTISQNKINLMSYLDNIIIAILLIIGLDFFRA